LAAAVVAAMLLAGCPSPPAAKPTGPPFGAHFDRFPPGPLQGFDGPYGNWTVVADATAPSPPNAAEAGRLPALVVAPIGTYLDGDYAVAFLAARNDTAQRAGIALAWVGELYDVLRADVALGRIELARYEGGRDFVVASGNATFAPGWHVLRAASRNGGHLNVSLDGAPVAMDGEPVARGVGNVGMWADGVPTRFDDLGVTPLA
jgi:hypothetical protein